MEIKVILSIPVTVSFLECRRWLDSVCDLCVCSWPSRLPTALGPASTHAPVVALLYVATVPHIGRHSLNTARLSFLWPMLPAFKRIILCLRVTLHRPLYLPLYGSDLSTLRVVSPVWCHLAILKAAHTLALWLPQSVDWRHLTSLLHPDSVFSRAFLPPLSPSLSPNSYQ